MIEAIPISSMPIPHTQKHVCKELVICNPVVKRQPTKRQLLQPLNLVSFDELYGPKRLKKEPLSTYSPLPNYIRTKPGTTIILNKLYLASMTEARSLAYLKKHGIKNVISLSLRRLPETVTETLNSYKFIRIPDKNHAKINQHFDEVYNFIEETTGSVLVHCEAGISRSATVVLAYLMRKNRWNFEESFRFVKEKRDIIQPNLSFTGQLKCFEQSLFPNL